MTVVLFNYGCLMLSSCWGGAKLGGGDVAQFKGQSSGFNCYNDCLFWFWDALLIAYRSFIYTSRTGILLLVLMLLYIVALLVRSIIYHPLFK